MLKAASMMDAVGNKRAAKEIAMIKVAAPSMAAKVIDRAMQVGLGESPMMMMCVCNSVSVRARVIV